MSIEFLIDEKLSDKKKANKKLRKIVRTVSKKTQPVNFDVNKAIFLKKFILALDQASKQLHNKKLAEQKLNELKQDQKMQAMKLQELRQAHIKNVKNIPEKARIEDSSVLDAPMPIRFDTISDIKARMQDNLEENKILGREQFKLNVNKEALQEALAGVKADKDFLKISSKKVNL